ncbi:ABC-type putative transport system ATPase component [Gaiella occulta]|uniref:ABC-type putative transport system ATPase component n=1 Tax=Gaiella occulta TaxID=1002870 RepID=A0A7M2YUF5_9ACTN|nr:ABC transporter ATP-binding protein [Gaiella occulta]RDI73249.1 ABC-type putative transport system ATPase component [Gaiella occulta]
MSPPAQPSTLDLPAAGEPAVTMRAITKRFPGVVANDAVDFEARVGEVHALLGENGAGKSTLSNILTGLYRADEGELELYGRPVEFHSPRDALDAGVGMVHQHFRLVEPFTVAENVVLGDHRDVGRSFLIRPRLIEQRVAELGARYGLAVDPRARVWQLSVGEQQRIEVLKALYREARVLILDEPTAVLTPQEADALFVTLRAMAAEGRTVIFISHKLHEVTAVADRVTVLRGGRSIGTVETAEATSQSLASLMVGREVEVARRREGDGSIGAVVLELDGLTALGDRGVEALKSVSLSVRAGEVVAVAGVAGNGQRELAEAVTGMRPLVAGTVRVDGGALRPGDPRQAIRAGIAHVPEDRLNTGVAPSLSIAANVVLKSYRAGSDSRGPFLRLRRIRDRALDMIQRYDVKAPGPGTPARQLSGGNLQKVVLAREFSGQPRVLVAAAPTRGLDVGAIETVHAYLREAAAGGVAVLLISEDLDEVLTLSDRVAVMYEGEIVGEVDARSATVEEIGLLMAGVRSVT